MAALGEETARIVRTAEEAAEDIRAKAEEAASRLRSDATQEAEAMRAEAAVILDQRREQAEAEAADRARRADEEAQQIMNDAAWRGQEMIREAESTRDEVLADLAERRRVAHLQVERLGAGRDRLLEAYRAVRQNLDEAVSTLDHAPEDARQAAEAAESLARRTRPERLERPAEPEPRASVPVKPEPAPPAPPEPELPAEVEPEPVPAEPEPVPQAELHAEPEPEPEPEPQPTVEAEPEQPPAEPEPEPAPAAAAAEGVFARIRAERAGPVIDHLEVRDAALDPLVSPLVRKLKRRLQDEQNDVLDRIRSRKGLPSLDEALGDLDQQTARYEAIAGDPLEAAAAAGADSVGGTGRSPAVAGICAGLAAELARPLRRGVGRALDAGAGVDDDQAVADGVGAAYREWRSARLENLVTEALAAAYVAGVHGASAGELVWIVDDGGDPCPDCEDNALAGPTRPGDSFPTGQLLPPAHPGCRCLLAPAVMADAGA